jgi:hypothetical protein
VVTTGTQPTLLGADLRTYMQATAGEARLTHCTLRKHASSPATLMASERAGAVALGGPAKVTLEHCYVEVGDGKSLACKASSSIIGKQ